jgi:hypothetical protein
VATSPVPQWAQEMSPYHRGPTGAGVLALAVVVVLVVLLLQVLPTTDSGDQATQPTRPPRCAQHWPPTCQEPSGGR